MVYVPADLNHTFIGLIPGFQDWRNTNYRSLINYAYDEFNRRLADTEDDP
jgi:hypothetical protein